MKIIITESQYNLLIESNFNKNKKLVEKMWDEGITFSEIKDLIGFTKSQLYFLLKDKEQRITCSTAYYHILDIISNTDLINQKIDLSENYKKSSLKFNVDVSSGILNFKYIDDTFKIEGMGTPYWNGECIIPVDIGYFEDLRSNNYIDIWDQMGMTVDIDKVPKEFNSFQELIDFMNNDYPYLIIPKIQNFIQHNLDRL